MTFEINDTGTEVILAETAAEGADYQDFVNVLHDGACKYGGESISPMHSLCLFGPCAVYDFPYDASENRSFNKIVFFNW